MTTRFVLRCRHSPHDCVEADERGVYRLAGERPWALEGPAELIEGAFEDLRDVASRVHREVVHIDFGNTVGVFRVRALGVIEVTSGKWDEGHFDEMLSDVARVAAALPFAAGAAGPLPYDRALSAREDLLYHAYVYLRHILSERAPRHVRLEPALNTILADPYRTADREIVRVTVDQIGRVDAAALCAIANAAGPMTRINPARLPAILDGHLPATLPERRFRTTTDTPENRFVKTFLESAAGVLERMEDALKKDTGFSNRVRAECRALHDRLAPFRRHPLWREVGTMTQLPANSTVLQRRRGYRDVYRHFVLLRLATRHLPISAHEARDLLEGKDIAALYEMWCYFRVVDVLRDLLGEPQNVDALATTDLQVNIAREFEVRWPCGVRALYNATFSKTKAAGRETYSLPLRPDVVLVLADGSVHVLDAKFKLAWLEGEQDDIERATVKLDDVYKMHAYRDAIEPARSAWVLYPGTETLAFTPAGGADGVEGVGALPLRPEPGGDGALRTLLGKLVDYTVTA